MSSKLKSSTTRKFNINPDEPEIDFVLEESIIINFNEYDENGNEIKEVTYTEDGDFEQMFTYQYNSKKLIVEEKLYFTEDEVTDIKNYEYNDKDQVIKKTVHYLDESFDVTNYSYDDNGNLISKITIDSDDYTESKETFKYSGEKLVYHAKFDGDDNLIAEFKYTQNEKGLDIEQEKWEVYDEKRTKFVIDYDEKGNKTKILTYNSEGHLKHKSLYEYNENNLVLKVVDEDEFNNNTISYEYDEKGNAIEQTEYNKNDDLISSISRKYNEFNNVIFSNVYLNRQGAGPNLNYTIAYEYEYF
jgi:YD repeat-containing protein